MLTYIASTGSDQSLSERGKYSYKSSPSSVEELPRRSDLGTMSSSTGPSSDSGKHCRFVKAELGVIGVSCLTGISVLAIGPNVDFGKDNWRPDGCCIESVIPPDGDLTTPIGVL